MQRFSSVSGEPALTHPAKGTHDSCLPVFVLDRNRLSSQVLAEAVTKSQRYRGAAVASSSEVVSAVASVPQCSVVISADLDLGASMGLQFVRSLHNKYPKLGIVLLLDRGGKESVIDAFRAGARGVFARTEPITDFLRCIDQVASGQIWAGKAESDFLLEGLRNIPAPHISCPNGNVHLSKRELEVVQYAARGYTNKIIADKLGLSEHTVKNYLFRSFEKLGVSSRVELLFFLTVQRQSPHNILDLVDNEPSLDNYCRIAEEGFAAANLALKIVATEGWADRKTEVDAYFWLRLMQTYGEQVSNRSRTLCAEVEGKLDDAKIRELEAEVNQSVQNFQIGEVRLERKTIDTVRAASSDLKTA